ncbi:MAG: hypothetical protein K6G00_08275, partial [Treponema sp.]|nr:hypothetical protein [Treponema sp.]
GVDGLSSRKESLAIRDKEMRDSVSSYISQRFISDLEYIYALEEELNEYKCRWGGILYKLKKILDKYSKTKQSFFRLLKK